MSLCGFQAFAFLISENLPFVCCFALFCRFLAVLCLAIGFVPAARCWLDIFGVDENGRPINKLIN